MKGDAIMKTKIIFLFSLLFPMVSCGKTTGLKRGDDYRTMWNYFEKENIDPVECKDYVLYKENGRSHAIRRSDDYRTIEEIRSYPLVTLTKTTFDIYVSGMTVFEIVEHFGIPDSVSLSTPFFFYRLYGNIDFQIMLFSDNLHIYYAM